MAFGCQLPGSRWLLRVHNVALRTGVLTGIYLSCVFVAWLLIANRVPRLEPFAGVRNLVAASLMLLLMIIPVIRFHSEPAKLFIAGISGWTILTLVYLAAEIRFSLLSSRMGATQIFVLGGVCYGFVAVFHWVFLMCATARQRHIDQTHEQLRPPTI